MGFGEIGLDESVFFEPAEQGIDGAFRHLDVPGDVRDQLVSVVLWKSIRKLSVVSGNNISHGTIQYKVPNKIQMLKIEEKGIF